MDTMRSSSQKGPKNDEGVGEEKRNQQKSDSFARNWDGWSWKSLGNEKMDKIPLLACLGINSLGQEASVLVKEMCLIKNWWIIQQRDSDCHLNMELCWLRRWEECQFWKTRPREFWICDSHTPSCGDRSSNIYICYTLPLNLYIVHSRHFIVSKIDLLWNCAVQAGLDKQMLKLF